MAYVTQGNDSPRIAGFFVSRMAAKAIDGNGGDGPLHRQHGLVAWAKFDSWCWWPALIVDQKKVMPKIKDGENLPRGSCMVCFFPEDAYNKDRNA